MFFFFFSNVLANNTGRPGSKKTRVRGRSIQREKGMKTLQRQVIGNPENNIVYYTCGNLEINPSIEISLSSVTIVCSVQCTRMHLLHSLRASVKDRLLFYLWIRKSEPMPWNIVNCRLFATSRLWGRPGRNSCQSALWDCFWGRICRHVENAAPI